MRQKKVFRFGKCWQGKAPVIVWQVALAGRLQVKGKAFLVLDCSQSGRGIRLTRSKPENLNPAGQIAALLRKYLPPVWGDGVLEDLATGDLWLSASSEKEGQRASWFIRLSHERPPELSAVLPDRTQLFRFGQKGTYTSRKHWHNPLPGEGELSDGFRDLFPDLLSRYFDEAGEAPGRRPATGVATPEPASADTGLVVFSKEQQDARKKLSRRLKTLTKSLQKRQAGLPSDDDLEQLGLKARLLQAFACQIRPGQARLTIGGHLSGTGNDVEIALDPRQTAGANITSLFNACKKQKKARDTGILLLDKLKLQIGQLEQDLALLRVEFCDSARIGRILHRYGLFRVREPRSFPRGQIKNQDYQPVNIFMGQSGGLFHVGKGPRENDHLTRGAKSDDIWVHAIGTKGSHVVVPRKSLKGGVPGPETKRTAAILALHFSKMRNSRAGEVYITRRRHLRKQKGLPVGLWLVDQAETFYVRYDEEELRQVLSCQRDAY